METTEQATPLRQVPTASPALRPVFLGESGIVKRPPHHLGEGKNPIGRTLSDDGDGRRGLLLSEDKQVSRLHATVYLEAGVVRVVDEQSRNGTSVNGQRIAESPLCEGDVLRIGNSFLILRNEPRTAT